MVCFVRCWCRARRMFQIWCAELSWQREVCRLPGVARVQVFTFKLGFCTCRTSRLSGPRPQWYFLMGSDRFKSFVSLMPGRKPAYELNMFTPFICTIVHWIAWISSFIMIGNNASHWMMRWILNNMLVTVSILKPRACQQAFIAYVINGKSRRLEEGGGRPMWTSTPNSLVEDEN